MKRVISMKTSLLVKIAFVTFISVLIYYTYTSQISVLFNRFLAHTVSVEKVNILTPITTQHTSIFTASYLTLNNSDTENVLSGSTGLSTADPRIVAMRKFLIDYHSPLYPYSEIFVKTADSVNLDWRLVASISGVESAFGRLIPSQSNNAWGWRGGPGGAYSVFSSWKDGIDTVTTRLALGYGTDLTPFQIEPTYCPPCAENPAHAWANGVTLFMNELDFYLNNLESL